MLLSWDGDGNIWKTSLYYIGIHRITYFVIAIVIGIYCRTKSCIIKRDRKSVV